MTVPSGGSADVNVSFSLDPQQVSGLEEVYINGFYVDGFVYLSDSTGEVPSLVIPFMGFHGDWNSGKVLDTYSFTDSYLNGIKLGSHEYDWHMMVPNVYGHLIDACRRIGRNDILTLHYWELQETVDLEQVFDSERFAGISPNGDNSFDYLCISVIPLRNASSLVFGIKSSDGTVLLSYETQEEERVNRFIGISHVFWLDELRSAGVDKEGEYTAFITAYRTPDSVPETVEMPFYVDNTAPEIEKFEIDGNTLKISAKDSRYLMGVELTDVKTGDWLTAIPVPGTGESDFTVDITEWADKDIKVSVMDYAKNKAVRYVGNVLTGDTDGNGVIDNVDLVTLARYIVNLEEFDGGQIARSDMNSDGIADNTDLVELARYLVGRS